MEKRRTGRMKGKVRGGVTVCPRCKAKLLNDADGDVYCLHCGWRIVPGEELSTLDARTEVGREGRRKPTHGGRRL